MHRFRTGGDGELKGQPVNPDQVHLEGCLHVCDQLTHTPVHLCVCVSERNFHRYDILAWHQEGCKDTALAVCNGFLVHFRAMISKPT